MNTRASVAYGWGVLILAGGGAYYFAKRSINADRAERAAKIEQERQYIQRIRENEYTQPSKSQTSKSGKITKELENKRSAKAEASSITADIVRQDPVDMPEKSKYEAAAPFRSRKGDRFS